MSLTYTNYFNSNYKRQIKQLYIKCFPKNERFPFWILKRCSKKNNIFFYAVSDNDELIGMVYIINCSEFIYLMYLAVDENKRGNGYGTEILKDLKKKYETIILSIEGQDKEEQNEKKKKRKEFYLKNGFYETNNFIEDNGVKYEVLCTNKNYHITTEKLKQRYIQMTESNIMKKIIRKIFNY